ncbi:hypothetical protein NW762_008366 [Fusarium torreyae]|uniref:Uncharacterized protein n=1 Tax=Fusarium torreyae TaxID=1237075 RepID=A0A9W8S023_9HYPO|nr:hypothetical protein NW762_008366 [Fusarium torreyae]
MTRLETVDFVFTANSDIFSLLNWASIKKARIGTLLAVNCWLTPLFSWNQGRTCIVPFGACTLNFKNEEQIYWREPLQINGIYWSSMSLWNSKADAGSDFRNDTAEFD